MKQQILVVDFVAQPSVTAQSLIANKTLGIKNT
jgi:hypothetical protein